MKNKIIITVAAAILMLLVGISIASGVQAEVQELEGDVEMLERGLSGLNLRVGSGLTAGFLRMNIKGLNDFLESAGFAGLDRNMFIYGPSAVAGRIAGTRLAFVYRRGSVDSSRGDTKSSMKVSYGGLIYEKGRDIYDHEDIDIALGAMIGAGRMELNLSAGDPGTFSELLEDTYKGEHNTATMKKSFLALKPNFNLHYNFSGSLALEFSTGYLLTHDLGRSWQIGGRTVSADPVSNLRGPHFSFKISYNL